MPDRVTAESPLSRRAALAWLGGLGLTVVVAGCAEESPSSSGTAGATTATGAAPSCVLTPELTEGPYYLDLDEVRSDITEGRPGAPLALTVHVVDADACTPIADAAVDVWHCDAGGAYSGVNGAEGQTFLRGVQLTDAAGAAAFQTIYPGWYSGRAVHIHLKVHLGTSDTFTGQLFFDDATTAAVYEREPYASRPGPDVLNAADGIFGESEGATIVAVTPEGDGYAGTVTLGVRQA